MPCYLDDDAHPVPHGADEAGQATVDYVAQTSAEAELDVRLGWKDGMILSRYKGQEVVERRYGTIKGPLAVAPMFLKSNRRIAALVTVICLALLIFCLIERQVRLAIAPGLTLDGLYVGRAAKPTGGLIFEALCGCA